MIRYFGAALIAAGTATGAAQAQGFSGGELSAQTQLMLDDFELGRSTYSGSLEGEAYGFGFAGDLSRYSFGIFDDNAGNVTLHGFYRLGYVGTAGLFFARDWLDGDDASLYGLEGAMDLRAVSLEGYLGQRKGDAVDGTMVGVSADVAFGLAYSAGADFDYIDGDDGDSLRRIALGGEYALAGGPRLWAEIGQQQAERDGDSDSSAFIGLGARIEFGPASGTTFDPRSLFALGGEISR
ncbi:hypothetical protein [Pseudoroseicyclus aestuarii]|uniref:Uncharacterized protein n=1 Tax=Pseudoroseicyclus aestuarii TaxID=1795041 RepID=A0A318T6R9_9RHOB|nr:hypothetical protein [Pseudoroseicyclus aestuarii]PYE84098.1 hypothetical protein DFP88_103464 [Pseudoroseicyclus aestuarii]